MKRIQNLLALAVAVLLVACVAAVYLTRDSATNRATSKKAAPSSQASPIDDRLLQTARQMSTLADTSDEQPLAAEALRFADDELDQAFAAALREAMAASPPVSGPLKQLTDHINDLKARIARSQARIAKLTKDAETSAAAADQLELAKAQVALDGDELEDAQQDLVRQGGDPHAKIEQALQEHEAAQHQTAQTPKATSASSADTLSEQAQVWLALGNRQQQLEAARQQAANNTTNLGREHDTLEKLIKKQPIPDTSAPAASDDSSEEEEEQEDTATMVARLKHLSDQRKSLASLDLRIQDSQKLADVYKRWTGIVETHRRSVLHLVLRSLAAVLGIVLLVLLIVRAIHQGFGSKQVDRKRLHQMRIIGGIAVQVVGVLLILLIIFGPPTQLSTIIGLATAGLTVALKDFIVAFFGWFALMGKNGIRVGDWVEIKGVGGEVIDIGVLKTVLLEMGTWTSTGHPTGRRVAFVNSYAIEGHYFNFSTAGQWLWDELQVTLPLSGDPYRAAAQIREVVERATEADAAEAEREWERVTRQYGTRPFSAKPAVDLQPTVNGLNVVVRYITHAPQRFEVKSRLFAAIVDLLHKPADSPV